MMQFLSMLRHALPARPPIGAGAAGCGDRMAHPDIARMDLGMLADLPPEELRDAVPAASRPARRARAPARPRAGRLAGRAA